MISIFNINCLLIFKWEYLRVAVEAAIYFKNSLSIISISYFLSQKLKISKNMKLKREQILNMDLWTGRANRISLGLGQGQNKIFQDGPETLFFGSILLCSLLCRSLAKVTHLFSTSIAPTYHFLFLRYAFNYSTNIPLSPLYLHLTYSTTAKTIFP